MTRAELKPLYVEATTRARTKPQRSEEDAWLKTLEYADSRDLRTAIDVHFQRSQWMPKESELRPLIEQAQRSRAIQLSAAKDFVAWRCESCKLTRSGFSIAAGSQHSPLPRSAAARWLPTWRGLRRRHARSAPRRRCRLDAGTAQQASRLIVRTVRQCNRPLSGADFYCSPHSSHFLKSGRRKHWHSESNCKTTMAPPADGSAIASFNK